ncbi:Alkane 1-monooxygenase [Paraburkholderia unamae]|uniref:LLM class flavin-dependent oxidoreductase n=1 Tax=Paraburkholderia unamae TaxID=219649 RepID=UPI001CB0257E|nr:LLM class flavin-dependent oxidoreductase [Paraburkholderia unamae]CAG9251894.1 Alkane 1-monooxygenase [Paraburkholderia unamae]
MPIHAPLSDSTSLHPDFRLSVLDKSPVAAGETPADALARSVTLARAADAWGYHRYWLAEHHNSATLACPAPEILIAHVLAQTRRIRVGSGGVMLQHYSPYKVAENFNLLASLAPGRVDMGIGKAPGGLPLSTRALQEAFETSRRPDFATLADELNRHLQTREPPPAGSENDAEGLRATPLPSVSVQPFLLGASVESATLAARLGWDFVYASHINASTDDLERTFEAYRLASGGRSPLLAISVVVAATHEDASSLAAGFQRFRVQVGDSQAINVGSLEQVDAFVRQSGGGVARVAERETRIVHGTRGDVLRELEALHRRYEIEEFVIDTPITDPVARIASLQLLANARNGASDLPQSDASRPRTVHETRGAASFTTVQR